VKYLLVLAVILVAVWLWRNNRRAESDERRARPAAPPAQPGPPQEMVSCSVCAVHLPRTEALAGPDGRLYCSPQHLLRTGT
jgi:uncharacterized protein